MRLTKAQKKVKSAELSELLKEVDHLYFTEYQGLKFKDLEDLRAKLKPVGGKYRVLKNSVLRHALKSAGFEGVDEKVLEGPNALILGRQKDPVSSAKILLKFSKENEALKLKGGFVDGKWMEAAQCKQLATIGGKPELQAKLASVLYSAVAQSVWVLAAPLQELALVLKVLEDKKKAEAAA